MSEREPKREEVPIVACEAHKRIFELLAEGRTEVLEDIDFLDAALQCKDCHDQLEAILAKKDDRLQ